MAIPAKIPVKVILVTKHTENVCSYVLKPEKKCPSFKPGQFLHLAIDPYDPSYPWPESRVFSIANSPTRKETIKITFVVKGRFTKRMYKEINEGDIVWLKLPYGNFTFNDSIENTAILIAGGTGITPYISFMEYAIDSKLNKKIVLYYGVRSKDLLLFADVISECENKLLNFKKVIYIEELESDEDKKYRKGILDMDKIYMEAENNNAHFYLSGPIEMIKKFKSYFRKHSVAETNIHIDEWE